MKRRHLLRKINQRKPNLGRLMKINREKMRLKQHNKKQGKYLSRNRLKKMLIKLQKKLRLKRN